MIGHMARCKHAFKRPIIAGNNIAMADNMVGAEIIISVFFQPRPIKLVWAGRAIAVNFRARALLQRGAGWRVIKMSVSDDNMADALIWAKSGQNGVDMGIKQRPGVNDC